MRVVGEQDDRDQEDEGAQDTLGDGLETPGGFRTTALICQ